MPLKQGARQKEIHGRRSDFRGSGLNPIKMENYLKILYVEDSPEDMDISLHYLKKSGYAFNVRRVETEGEFRSELESGDWDIILCDYALPQFSGPEALKIVAASGRKIPIIVVTGAIGEEKAVKTLVMGADNYILKDNLTRLGPAIKSAIEKQVLLKKNAAANEALRHSEERYRRIFENIQDVYYRLDPSGVVIAISPSVFDRFGYRPTEIMEKKIDAFMPFLNQKNGFFTLMKRESKVNHYEMVLNRKNGDSVWVDINGHYLYGDDGTLIGMEGIIRDISESKTLQAQVIQAEKMAAVGLMVSGVAHELNNPLTSIIGFSEAMSEDFELPEKALHCLNTIRKEARRSAGIVNDLLAFSRQETADKMPVSINSAVLSAVGLLNRRMVDDDIAITLDLDPAGPVVLGDGNKLCQVILNIASNSLDSMRTSSEGKRVVIRTLKKGGSVEIHITDNGPGMDNETLGRVFDPFFTTKPVGKGTGLGLSVSYGIIADHGGSIQAHSTLGAGTGFVVVLPLKGRSARPSDKGK